MFRFIFTLVKLLILLIILIMIGIAIYTLFFDPPTPLESVTQELEISS